CNRIDDCFQEAMNAVAHEQDSGLRQQFFNCNHADCGATFKREWRLKEHETVHTGAQPFQCEVSECGGSFSRKSHLSRHVLCHTGMHICELDNCFLQHGQVEETRPLCPRRKGQVL
ncbi:unnamed protein product, partial [Oncorhynchus mykiss]